jgi:hypothetical protein
MRINKIQIKSKVKQFILGVKLYVGSFLSQPNDAEYVDSEKNIYLKSICMDMDCGYDVMEYKKLGVFRYKWIRGYRYDLKNLRPVQLNHVGLSSKYEFKNIEV